MNTLFCCTSSNCAGACRGRWHRGCRGLTLLELLLAMTVVALVAFLIMATYNTSRERQNRLICASNLRQIGMALFAYAADHSQHLPTSQTNAGDSSWDAALVAGDYVGSLSLFRCPSDHVPRDGYGERPAPVRSYGISAGFDGNEISYWIHGARLNCLFTSQSNEIVLVAEKAWHQNLAGVPSIGIRVTWTFPPESPHTGTTEGNYLFLDGHVAWVQQISTNMFPPAPAGRGHAPCP